MIEDQGKQTYNILQMIWNVTNTLHFDMNSNEYSNFLIGIVFYKYLSDKTLYYVANFLKETDDELHQIQKKYEKAFGNQELRYMLIEDVQKEFLCYIEPTLTFTYFIEKINSLEFRFEDLLYAFKKLEMSDELYNNIFDSVDLYSIKLEKLSQNATKSIIEFMKKLSMLNVFDKEGDLLGIIYEHLISLYPNSSEKESGEFYAPQSIAKLMAQIILFESQDKDKVTVYDGAMGSGSLLLNVMKYSYESKDIYYYGQELNRFAYNIARMNMILNGMPIKKLKLHKSLSLKKDWPINTVGVIKFDAVIMDPPYSMKWGGENEMLCDPRFSKYGVLAPKSNADFAFLLHGFYHLKDTGTMAIILPYGALLRENSEGKIRKRLLDEGAIYAVIAMPDNIFFSTRTSTTVLILKKSRVQKDVLFIDASKEFYKDKNRNIIADVHIQNILDTYSKRKMINNYSYIASYEEIVSNQYNLNIYNYINTLSDAVGESNDLLKDVAKILTNSDSKEIEGIFIRHNDLKYPIMVNHTKQNGYGIKLEYGDIIICPGGRKFLFYETAPKMYILSKKAGKLLIIRPKIICPEVLFLYLETKEISDFLFNISGRTMISRIRKKDLENVPLSEDLPPLSAYTLNKPYIDLFIEKYCSCPDINNLSSLLKSVHDRLLEKTDISKECIELIKKKEEGIYWDFKKKHYVNAANLLHDIICMANNIADRDSYIILGVEDKTGRVVGVEHDDKRKDSTYFNSILKTAKFSEDNIPVCSLHTFTYKNHEIDVLVIKHTINRPYSLIESYRKEKINVRANIIYSRESDSNTDIDKSASSKAISHLWQERFIKNKN